MRAPTPEQSPLLDALHVAALWCFSVAGPLLAVLAANGEMLVAHRITGTQITLLVWSLVLLPPLLWLAAQHALRCCLPRSYGWLQGYAVAGLSWLGMLMLWHRWLAGSAPALLAVSLASVIGWMFCYLRLPSARSFVSVLGMGVVVLPLGYLYGSPLARLRAETRGVAYAPVRSATPVVVLVLDELPLVSLLDADHNVDATLFPNFSRLQHQANWYRNATAVADATLQCVPAILSGSYPRNDAMPLLSEYPRNLFTFLGGSYDMRVHESVTSLCPLDASRLPERVQYSRFGRDLAVLYLLGVAPGTWSAALPDVASELNEYGVARQIPRNYEAPQKAARRPEIVRDFVASMRGGPRTLNMLHVILPHVPWLFLPDGQSYAAADAPIMWGEPTAGRWLEDDWSVTRAWQRHLLQVQFADRLLGEMMDRMHELGLDDQCVFVVVADHGESFTPGHERRRLERDNADEILPVPLFIKLPGQHVGHIDDANAQTIDVLPTIAQTIGAPLPWKVDGRSLLSGEPIPHDKHAVNRDNARFTLSASLSLDEPLRRKLARFGSHDASVIYRCAPRPQLIGRRLADFARARGGDEVGYRLVDEDDFDDVAPDGMFVPCWVRGSLDAPLGGEVAIAVNGVIRAETPVYVEADGAATFSAMVPPKSFVAGSNRVEVYGVRGGARVELRPMARLGADEGVAASR